MSKISQALGAKYQENKLSILTRKFTMGDYTAKVRVPTVKEMEVIYEYFKNPNEDDVEKTYQQLLLLLSKEEKEEVEKTGMINGRSLKETARNKTVIQYRIVEYIKFLIPENGESLADLEYADVEEEYPFAIQLALVDKIHEVISPDYKEIHAK
jgi:hypothetical protein